MRNKQMHAKLLSLLLTLVMVLSTAVVFAEGEELQSGNETPLELEFQAKGASEDVTISGNSSVNVGDTIDLTAVLSESVTIPDGASVTWTWKSSAQEKATVAGENSSAKVTGVAAGTTTVTASATVVDGDVETVYESAPFEITVSEVELVITLNTDSATVEVGKTVTLTATATPEEATVTWSSDNANVATVDNGVVTGKGVGTTTLKATATLGDKTAEATCTITVFTNVKPVLTPDKKYDRGYEYKNDNGYYLDWKHTDTTGVRSYQILRDGKVIEPNAKTHYEILSPSGTHNYVVRAVLDNGKYIDSDPVSITVKGVITETHAYTWWCVTKKKVKITKKAKGGGTVATVAKGTKMTAIGRYPTKVKKFKNPKKVQVRLSNGKVGWVPYKSLKGGVKGTYNVSSDYSRSLKEYMVNNPAFSKNTKESSAIRGVKVAPNNDTLLWASLYTQRVYTFKKKNGKWELVHSDRITTGKFSNPTRSSETSGVYTINKKKKGKVWMVQQNGKRYYFTHASYITKGISFHTGTWWASGKHRGSVVASGAPGTYGCIRMYTDGAKYIFANTTINKTKVFVTRFD